MNEYTTVNGWQYPQVPGDHQLVQLGVAYQAWLGSWPSWVWAWGAAVCSSGRWRSVGDGAWWRWSLGHRGWPVAGLWSPVVADVHRYKVVAAVHCQKLTVGGFGDGSLDAGLMWAFDVINDVNVCRTMMVPLSTYLDETFRTLEGSPMDMPVHGEHSDHLIFACATMAILKYLVYAGMSFPHYVKSSSATFQSSSYLIPCSSPQSSTNLFTQISPSQTHQQDLTSATFMGCTIGELPPRPNKSDPPRNA